MVLLRGNVVGARLREPIWKLGAGRLGAVGTIRSKASDLFFGLIRVDKATGFSYTPAVALKQLHVCD